MLLKLHFPDFTRNKTLLRSELTIIDYPEFSAILLSEDLSLETDDSSPSMFQAWQPGASHPLSAAVILAEPLQLPAPHCHIPGGVITLLCWWLSLSLTSKHRVDKDLLWKVLTLACLDQRILMPGNTAQVDGCLPLHCLMRSNIFS